MSVHVPPHDKAAEYRRRAQQMRATAWQVSLHDVRRQLLKAAEHLEGLAAEEERRAGHTDRRSKPDPEA
jgi:hypothetical protein